MNDMKTQMFRCLQDEEPLPEIEPGMSNFDHVVQDGVVEGLADGQHQASYPGWNFYAVVYLAGEGLYVADVHQYHSHVDFIGADTLDGLMEAVSDEWGWE